MNRQELFDLAKSLKRKALELAGAGHVEGAMKAEFEYHEICRILHQAK